MVSSSGTLLAQGDAIRLGYFAASATSSLVESSNSYSTLNAAFTAFGEGTIPTSSGTLNETGTPVGNSNTMYVNNAALLNVSGAFFGSFTLPATFPVTSGTQQLYMWVFNSSNPATATQWGIFTDASWTFPPNLGAANMTMNSSGIQPLRYGGTTGSDYELASIPAVPEPSTFALLAGAMAIGITFICRRR